jgi:uncharacterized protein (TIGR03084 family)
VADLTALLNDLAAESAELESHVSSLSADDWKRDTPAEGWTIAHQIAHLAWTDDVAALAATDPEAFSARVQEALPRLATFVDEEAAAGAALPTSELLARWQAGRAALGAALASLPDGQKLPWFGPPMSAASMATARLMETFAHGQDVLDALGVTRVPTNRIRHVAHIGVRTRNFAYLVNDRTPPAEEFRVELTAPDGEIWTWGPEDAAQRVTGSALDFCLRVTQRRHLDDLDLKAVGDDANEWLSIAQAFAGPPGEGRPAMSSSTPKPSA